ncbi:hypothetical protein AB838_06195 [Rhodobacteraceae bacterium (ex Bugula neritina AB1)]|nr:hypothetical protein AB838_06195 [Rhodobacteraceae bacterium (ex Bugula neritina AB1)]
MTAFYRFLLARFLSALGTQITLFAAPLIVFQITGSVSKAGLSFAIEWGVGLLALPFAGIMADRIGGSRLYAVSDGIRLFACATVFLLLNAAPQHAFLIVSISAGIMCFCLNQAFVALETLIPKYMPSEELHKAQSMLQAVDQFSLLLGPVAAAALLAVVDKEVLYLIAGSAFFVSLLNMLLSRGVNAAAERGDAGAPLADILHGAKILISNHSLMLLCAYGILVNVVYCSLLSIGAAMVTGTFGLPEFYFGALSFTAAAVTICSMFIVPVLSRRYSIFFVGVASFLGVSLGGFIAALASQYWVFFVGFAVVVMADASAGVYLRTERVKNIPKQDLGKTLGLMVLVIVFSYPLAGLIVSVFSERIGINAMLFGLSGICLVGNVFVMIALKKATDRKLTEMTAPGENAAGSVSVS